MSWSMTCVLPWQQLDIDRVVTALDEALRQCAVKWPAYAKAVRDPPDSTSSRLSVHVMFPAELVEAPGWELERPSATPDDE